MTDPLSEVMRLAEAQLRDEITPAEAQRLEALVSEDRALRRHYVRYLQDSHKLHELSQYLHDSNSERLESPGALGAATSSRSPLLGFLSSIQPAEHPLRFWAVAAMLTGMFWATLMFVFWPLGERNQPWRERSVMGDFIARVQRVPQAEWAEGQQPLLPGMNLDSGTRIELTKGSLQLVFGDGANVVIAGPATARIEGRNRVALEQGRLLARAEGAARGFTVETPTVNVVDLGTEFGVEARPRETEVQVFSGQIEVSGHDVGDHGAAKFKRVLSAQQAALFGNSPQRGFYAQEKKMNKLVYATLAAVMMPLAGQGVSQAVTVDFFGTTQTDDTALIASVPNSSFGAATNLDLGNSGGSRRSLLRFNTLGTELAGETVVSASLTLTKAASIGSFTNQAFDLYVIMPANAGWVEGDGGDFGSTTDGYATWNHLARHITTPTLWAGGSGSAASTPAIDIHPTPIGTFVASSADSVGTTYTIDFADISFLQTWIDNPGSNAGFLIRWQGIESGPLLRIASSETGASAPLLSIELFQEPAMQPAPEPASGAALGLGGLILLGLARARRNASRERA